MPAYISEFQYYGDSSEEFVEVALPQGTDPSGYSLVFYDYEGNVYNTFTLGSYTNTMNGHDVYVLDDSTSGFTTSDETGNFYPDDAIALVDGDGNVVQFISYWDNTVVANGGPADGMTSTDVGTAGVGQSMQSDDGGQTYYAQSSPNSGSIPACYGVGTLISTIAGPKAVEDIVPGDILLDARGGITTVRWIWSGTQALDDLETHQRPVLIRKNAFSANCPNRDLVVSSQHRIAVGCNDQMAAAFRNPALIPAKALVETSGVRSMNGKRSIIWHHFVCDDHSVVFANNVASESMLLGDQTIKSLNSAQLRELSQCLGVKVRQGSRFSPSLPCLNVGEARRILASYENHIPYKAAS